LPEITLISLETAIANAECGAQTPDTML